MTENAAVSRQRSELTGYTTEYAAVSRQCSELTGYNEPTPAVYRFVTMSRPADGDRSFLRNINIYLTNDTVLHGRGLVILHLE
jgi:hypothetical protein